MGRGDKGTLYKCGDDSQTSKDSIDSFECDYSEYSDCELCEERRRRRNKARNKLLRSKSATPLKLNDSTVLLSPCSGNSNCYTAMDLEAAPLLIKDRTPSPGYKSFSDSDSLGPGELSSSEILSTLNKRNEKKKPEEKKKQSSLVTIFSVWNTIMGSSLLTMAWGVEQAGLPAALLLFAVMAAICLYTANVLLTINRHHGSATCEVPALCRALLGRGAEAVAHSFSLLVLVGANVVYWILITNFLYHTVNYLVEQNSSNTTLYNSTILCPKHDSLNGSLLLANEENDASLWGLHTSVPVYVALVMFPLISFGNVSFFTKFNSLGTISAVYLMVFVLYKGLAWGVHAPERGLHAARDAAGLSGMLALSFYIHNIVITVMSRNDRQENNGRDLTIAFLLVTVTYTFVGGVFYICFPLAKSCIEDNILNNFEMHDVLTAIARVLLLFQVVTVYPLMAYMLRCEAMLLLPFRNTRCLTFSINAAIVLVCILVACFCPNIGTIIRYTGAVSGLVHIFALPSLLQVRSLHLRGKLTWPKTVFYALIIMFGAVNLILQFFITET